MGIQGRYDADEFQTDSEVRAELHRLESAVERLSRALVPDKSAGGITPKQLRLIIKARRKREEMFGGELFADPAWDILLEAYLSRLMQLRLSVSALCVAAAVPATTALRWLQKLEHEGWLSRQDDPLDGRRTWIKLTEWGHDRLTSYFQAVDEGVLPL